MLRNDDADEEHDGDVIEEEVKSRKASEKGREKEKQPTGRVVGIIKRNWRS